MSAGSEALISYGYRFDQEKGRYVSRSGNQWEETEGGWLRFMPDGSAMPLKVREDSPQQAGLMYDHPAHHDAFVWVFPDEYLVSQYGAAVAAGQQETLAIQQEEIAQAQAAQEEIA